MKKTQFISLLMCALLLCGMMAGCGASSNDEAMDAAAPQAMETVTAVEMLESGSTLDGSAQVNRKLIKTVHLDAETEYFDDLLTNLNRQITELGGYVENRDVNNGRYSRYCSMTIRIPADRLDTFVTHVTENANVTRTSESTEDVTLQYVDTEAKITALETEQARLLELLAQAQNLTEILEIEARLSDVTYELERYASQKRSYDNLVAYATVYLELHEVEILTPMEEPTVWERMTSGFSESLSDLGEDITDVAVWFVAELPYILVWAIIFALAFVVLKRILKKPRKAAPPPPENK